MQKNPILIFLPKMPSGYGKNHPGRYSAGSDAANLSVMGYNRGFIIPVARPLKRQAWVLTCQTLMWP